jgi:hypothetical protein
MSLRMPQTLFPTASRSSGAESALSALHGEMQAEGAAALGRAGRDLEQALAALSAIDPADPARAGLLQGAADAVWRYFIQREACGALNHDQAVADYAIPREVLARVGAKP